MSNRTSLRKRLGKLEQEVPPLPESDEWWSSWLWFRDLAYTLLELEGFSEALAFVRQRVEGNERHVFPGNGPIIRNGSDVRRWIMVETLWAALRQHPQAQKALQNFLGQLQADKDAKQDKQEPS
jgi:hypothetical protein